MSTLAWSDVEDQKRTSTQNPFRHRAFFKCTTGNGIESTWNIEKQKHPENRGFVPVDGTYRYRYQDLHHRPHQEGLQICHKDVDFRSELERNCIYICRKREMRPSSSTVISWITSSSSRKTSPWSSSSSPCPFILVWGEMWFRKQGFCRVFLSSCNLDSDFSVARDSCRDESRNQSTLERTELQRARGT